MADLHRRICAACGRTPGGEPLTRASAARANPEVGGTSAAAAAAAAAGGGGVAGAVPPADALLFVSGSHPARQVPFADR
jgi:hypothetical protein